MRAIAAFPNDVEFLLRAASRSHPIRGSRAGLGRRVDSVLRARAEESASAPLPLWPRITSWRTPTRTAAA